MPFIPVPNAYEAQIRMTLDSQLVENTLYFTPSATNEAPDQNVLTGSLLTWWLEDFAPNVSQQLFLREIYLVDLTTESSPTWTQPAPAPQPHGGRALEASPNNVALCMSFRTSARGRSYRGRNYVPGIASDDVSNNTVSPTIVSGLTQAYESLFNVSGDGGWDWVIVSRFHNGDARPQGVITPVQAVLVVDATVDSQRRRLPGRGR